MNVERDFLEDVRFHETKCRQHLARARLALMLGIEACNSASLERHKDLVELAVPEGRSIRAVEEALSKSLFLDLKVNFELFLWTACRAWLRHDFVPSMMRLRRGRHGASHVKEFLERKSFTQIFHEDVADFLPAHGLELLAALLKVMTPNGQIINKDVWPQIQAAFAIRHAIEHRNGRIDERFIKSVKDVWSRTTWNDVPLEVDAVVPVRLSDFEATYMAMDQAVEFIGSRLSTAWSER